MQYLDKYGWPVERIEGRYIQNFIRLLLHTRKVVKHWESPTHSTAETGCDAMSSPS